MQEKESVMVASLVIGNSYPCDGIFDPTSQLLKILIVFMYLNAGICIRIQDKNMHVHHMMLSEG